MDDKYAIIITTINHPTRAIKEIALHSTKLNAEFIIVGDSSSPKEFKQEGSTYLDLEAQRDCEYQYAKIAPDRHYARKNIGYLYAIHQGATVIIETDDDNIPRDAFWTYRQSIIKGQIVEGEEWVNTYSYFTDKLIWPRGLPLDRVQNLPPSLSEIPIIPVYCPIQQGLADDNPDVDAIYRLVYPLPVIFMQREPIILRGTWCPFNSQNTTWWQDAFPLLYLPYHCSFRMTDIWRSFIAQRIAYLNNWGILFHSATVFQERNEHNLIRDFHDEIPGYLHNQTIREALVGLSLKPGKENIPDALRTCYVKLVELKFIDEAELMLLDAWLEDIYNV